MTEGRHTMSKTRQANRPSSKLDLIETIANPVRRAALRELLTRTGHVDTKELASATAARVTGTDLVDVTRHERDSVHVALVHTHLKKLVVGGLVEWDETANAVTTTAHPAFRDDRFQSLLTGDAAEWDAVLRALQCERRRIAVGVLAETERVDREGLARRVAAREAGVDPPAVSERRVDDVRVSLHHVHLPILEEAGLIDDEDPVKYVGHPDLNPAWLTVASRDFADDEADESSGQEEPTDGRTTDGTEAVVNGG